MGCFQQSQENMARGYIMAKKFALVVAVCLGAAASWAAQTAAPARGPQSAVSSAAQKAVLAPTDADIYCAGFFTRRSIEPGLLVLGSEDGALKY